MKNIGIVFSVGILILFTGCDSINSGNVNYSMKNSTNLTNRSSNVNFNLFPNYIDVYEINSIIYSKGNTIYEDAEDGTTLGWYVYDNSSNCAEVLNIDNDNTRVIQLKGKGLSSGFVLRDMNGEFFNNLDARVIEWKSKFVGEFIIFISIRLDDDSIKYLEYSPVQYEKMDDVLFIKLHQWASDGKWYTYKRDLRLDLQRYFPNRTIKAVLDFQVRGEGCLDDIRLIKADLDKEESIADQIDALSVKIQKQLDNLSDKTTITINNNNTNNNSDVNNNNNSDVNNNSNTSSNSQDLNNSNTSSNNQDLNNSNTSSNNQDLNNSNANSNILNQDVNNSSGLDINTSGLMPNISDMMSGFATLMTQFASMMTPMMDTFMQMMQQMMQQMMGVIASAPNNSRTVRAVITPNVSQINPLNKKLLNISQDMIDVVVQMQKFGLDINQIDTKALIKVLADLENNKTDIESIRLGMNAYIDLINQISTLVTAPNSGANFNELVVQMTKTSEALLRFSTELLRESLLYSEESMRLGVFSDFIQDFTKIMIKSMGSMVNQNQISLNSAKNILSILELVNKNLVESAKKLN